MESSETVQEHRVRHRGEECAKGIQQGDPRAAQTVLPASSSGLLNMSPKMAGYPQFLDSHITGIYFSLWTQHDYRHHSD